MMNTLFQNSIGGLVARLTRRRSESPVGDSLNFKDTAGAEMPDEASEESQLLSARLVRKVLLQVLKYEKVNVSVLEITVEVNKRSKSGFRVLVDAPGGEINHVNLQAVEKKLKIETGLRYNISVAAIYWRCDVSKPSGVTKPGILNVFGRTEQRQAEAQAAAISQENGRYPEPVRIAE
jgi:hypothetical protein